MNKRPRLTDGYHRPSEDDNSSSGCSSAGPSGLRNLITSPVSTNGRSMSGSFLSRPSPVDEQKLPTNRMMSSSRYLPYTIRPLVVRAKRKMQNDSVHVTSTAQRIINALETISTPVVNSVKIPFEPVLASRPVFTPIRRDTQGPPILKSPLVPSPQGKIVYNPGVHIPRMVDFGTNTELTMLSLNLEKQLATDSNETSKSSGGGKMKVMTSRVHAHAPTVRSNNVSAYVPARPHQTDFKGGSSKYKFSSPWSTNDLKKVFPVIKGTKSVDAVDNSKTASGSKPSTSTAEPLSKPKEAEPAKTFTGFSKPATLKGWDCPTCMVPNKADAPACVCCGEKNPSPPAAAAAAPAKPPQKDWECPSCMVFNKPDAAACVCCSEKNPNGPPASAAPSTPAPKPAFQFGFSSSTPKTASDTFTFGPPKDSSTPKSTFTFGVKSTPPSTASTEKSSSTPSFTFGIAKPADTNKSGAETKVNSTPEPAKPFAFGSANSTPSVKPTSSSITFGLPAEPSAATAVKSSPTFSSGMKAPEAAISPKADVPSAAEKFSTPQSNPFKSFSFGSPAASTPVSSKPTSVIPEETWACGSCPAKNRMVLTHCVGCSAAKPKADDKSKSSAAPPGAKKFHFEPFFGGRPDQKSFTSTPEPEVSELKRKIPSNSSASSGSSLGFTYTPPSEPTLKMKAPESNPASATAAAPEMKTGSFLDALKTKSQFTFAAPQPGTSLIPTSPPSSSGSIISSSTSIPTPSAPLTSSNLSSTLTSAASSAISTTTSILPTSSAPSAPPALTGPPSGLFQFGATSTPTANKTIATPNFGTGALANNALNQNTFSFGATGGGGSSSGALKNGPLPSVAGGSSNPAAPSIFGANLPAGGGSSGSFLFGGTGGGSATPASSGGLGGGGGLQPQGGGLGPGAAAAGGQPSSSGFSFSPNLNLNFGSAAAGATAGAGPAPPGGPTFVFSAQPSGSPQPGDGGARKIRRATRRIR